MLLQKVLINDSTLTTFVIKPLLNVESFQLWNRLVVIWGFTTPTVLPGWPRGIWKGEQGRNYGTAVGVTTLEEMVYGFHQMDQRNTWDQCTILARLLQECISSKAMSEGKQVHSHIIKSGLPSDVFVGNNLVNMYAKCGSLADARQVFDKMPERDVISWNAILAGYAHGGQYEDALLLFRQMRLTGMQTNRLTFSSVLKVCASLGLLPRGKQVHAHMSKTGLGSDGFVGSSLVDMYCKCGSIEDARQVFDRMPKRDLVLSNVMIEGYARLGNGGEALKLFAQIQQRLDKCTFASVLKACTIIADFELVTQVQTHIIKSGFELDVFVGTVLVGTYAKCGNIEYARQVFDKIPKPNVVSWNTMIAGYAQGGHGEFALKLFIQMQNAGLKMDCITFAGVLCAIASAEATEHGKQVHSQIIKLGFESDVSVGNSLVSMYVKCRRVEDGHQLFDKMPTRDLVSWNTMISSYVQNGQGEEALHLFCQMQPAGMKPDQFTFASGLRACSIIAPVDLGKQVHASIIKTESEVDVFVESALVDMYAKHSSLDDARSIFDKMSKRDLVSWNAMIAGYAQNQQVEEPLKLFRLMQQAGMKPNQFTLASILKACACLTALEQGKQVHAHIIKSGLQSDVCVGSGLIDIYVKCGNIEDAHTVFYKMHQCDEVSWTTIIAGYVQNEHEEDALKLYCQMQLSGIKPDEFTFTSLLKACASLAGLEQGKQIHANIIKTGFESDLFVASALVDMFAKCGSITNACSVFDRMATRNVISWNTMIAGCARHGRGEEALKLFQQMQDAGMDPDHITFIGVLSACSHAGLVEDSHFYFDSMSQDFGIAPRLEHYACMVDLLGRAGFLDEAEDFIYKMPFEPGALVWRTLLGACRVHGNIEIGKHAAECLHELEPQDSATYVLLSNIYAASGQWDDVTHARKMMKNMGVKKEPGYSWIEVKNRIHVFVVGDRSHPHSDKIYAKLEDLIGQMETAGYVPDTDFVLLDVEQEYKENTLYHHSEKLAIAFGLISTSPVIPIRIIKNLRVCGDCHTATKFISKLVEREIIIRDANRFHHFNNGKCSCGDYW